MGSRVGSRIPAGPPERVTVGDIYRVVLGLLAIPLGLIILFRIVATQSMSPPGVLVGVAFIGFGVYRTRLALRRYRLYRQWRDERQ
jgi:uncharacterized membrane protein HdeD (DUF308 family)